MQNGLTFQTDEIGISVTIEETSLLPTMKSDYISMVPGNAYDVQLSLTETSRIEAPYTSQCRNDYPEICKNTGAYSTSRCSQGCVKYQLDTACNCTEYGVLEGDLEKDFKAITAFCNFTHLSCIINRWKELGKTGMEKYILQPCTPECHRFKYAVGVL